jgi:RNA polymerase sigma-70 factor (family 1)
LVIFSNTMSLIILSNNYYLKKNTIIAVPVTKTIMHLNESAILQRLKNGDNTAYKEIYNRYHSRLYYYVLKFLKDPDLAEDVIHDVFLKLWEVREQINPNLFILGYLYRISRNMVYKMIKKIATEEDLRSKIIFFIDEAQSLTESKVQWDEYATLLEGAINQLPPQCRRVFKLCREEGKTYDQTAALLGISKHTVKEHMMMAMKSIKQYFFNHADIVFTLTFCIMLPEGIKSLY